MSYRAVYRDSQGHTYSAPVFQRGDQWLMRTSKGLAPVTLQFDDDQGGRLEFVGYRDEPDERLHIEPKQSGQSSLARLQSAAAKVEAQARADRYRNAQQLVAQTDAQDTAKVRQARAINTQLAQKWNPKRPEPVPPQIPNKEVMAEAARYRRKRTEES